MPDTPTTITPLFFSHTHNNHTTFLFSHAQQSHHFSLTYNNQHHFSHTHNNQWTGEIGATARADANDVKNLRHISRTAKFADLQILSL